MKWNILTVGRQFGSGGRTIAKSVAERLGIPYYDKEIVEKVALETGFSEDYSADAPVWEIARTIAASTSQMDFSQWPLQEEAAQ